MSGVNARVVYRSMSHQQFLGSYAFKRFGYSEQSSLGRWYAPGSFIMTTLLLLTLTTLGPFAWFRSLLSNFVPSPGEGPLPGALPLLARVPRRAVRGRLFYADMQRDDPATALQRQRDHRDLAGDSWPRSSGSDLAAHCR